MLRRGEANQRVVDSSRFPEEVFRAVQGLGVYHSLRELSSGTVERAHVEASILLIGHGQRASPGVC